MNQARLELVFKRGTGILATELVKIIASLPEGTLITDAMEVGVLEGEFDQITLIVENKVFNNRGTIFADFKREATIVDGHLVVFNSFAGLNLSRAIGP